MTQFQWSATNGETGQQQAGMISAENAETADSEVRELLPGEIGDWAYQVVPITFPTAPGQPVQGG